MLQIGIDIGAISLGAIFIKDNKVIKKYYKSHKGNIKRGLEDVFKDIKDEKIKICITKKDRYSFNIPHLDPIVALTDGALHFYPNVSHILYIGGESYTLIHLKNGKLQDYSINSSCASGTGAFLEQQAQRLGMSIEEFTKCAEEFKGVPPRVATRCAVFAKSDIIHLQQDGVPVEAIAAGLCDSLVDGLIESLLKGTKLEGITVLSGGVSLNKRVVKKLSRFLEKPELNEFSPLLGAYGAALYAAKVEPISTELIFKEDINKKVETRPPLKLELSSYPDFSKYITKKEFNTEITIYNENLNIKEIYLGIDIGSTSTKAIIITPDKKIWAGFYTATAGKPVEAVKNILKCIKKVCEEKNIELIFKGIGTTGSGRKLLKVVLKADLEINEITAHAKAGTFLFPEVDTILEIGGQDAKFTRISNGTVTNAVMNYVCAAGTGSFIEEQAKRLNIPLNKFAEVAMKGKAPITSERCTVYMERDINRLIQQGWSIEDIAAAVIYSVRDNYLNKVVAGAPIGDHILFQGATARNKALIAAFENFLKKEIKVFPYAHLTGALGVCLTLIERGIEKSSFEGLSFIDKEIKLETEYCNLCANKCRLTVIDTGDSKEAYGMMCGRDYSVKKYVPRQVKYYNFLKNYTNIKPKKVLIPNALAMMGYLPLWRSFFTRLGFEVKVLNPNRKTFEKGKQIARAEFCAPLLTAQGIIWKAIHEDGDIVFFPIFYKEASQDYGEPVSAEGTPSFFCYYTSHLPAIIRSRLPENLKDKLISPLLQMDLPREEIIEEIAQSLEKCCKIDKEEIKWAYEKAEKEFLEWKQRNIEEGKKIISQIPKNGIGLVILGRPYNTFDPTMNSGLVEKIIQLGYPTIYYDMLDIKEEIDDPLLQHIHWNYGKKIYRAARYIAESENLFPIYLTSFRCSPDAFIMTYFKHLMDNFKKPYLIIQLDEHCSDVGYITRVEAAIDSFKAWKKSNITAPSFELGTQEVSLNKTILIPHVDEIAARFVAASFESYGYRAIVLEETPSTVLEGFRYTIGTECLAIPAILGGIIKAIEKYELDPANAVVFLPTSYVSCNFPQIPIKISMALKKAGMPVKVINTSSFNLIKRLLFKMDLVLWDSIIMSHALREVGCALRPYEINKGETDKKIEEAIKIMEKTIREKKNKGIAWEKVTSMFKDIKVDKSIKKPKILITGDLYVRNNDAFNQNIVKKIEELGGEVLLSSIMEYFHYGLELDRYEKPNYITQKASYYVLKKILESYEDYYYKWVRDYLPNIKEPSWDEMFDTLREMGINLSIQGETAITVSRAVSLARTKQINAVVHINPSFCCAGNVSASLLEKIKEEYGLPVLNIFYDGTDQPNNIIIPFMHYLCEQQQEDKIIENKQENIYLNNKIALE